MEALQLAPSGIAAREARPIFVWPRGPARHGRVVLTCIALTRCISPAVHCYVPLARAKDTLVERRKTLNFACKLPLVRHRGAFVWEAANTLASTCVNSSS